MRVTSGSPEPIRDDPAAESGPAKAPAADPAPEPDACHAPVRTGAGPIGDLMGDLIRRSLDLAAAPDGTAAPNAKLELLAAAIRLFLAIKDDPAAADKALSSALYDHKELCGCLEGLGDEIKRDPKGAVLSGLSKLGDAVGGSDARGASAKLARLAPRATASGSASSSASARGSWRGSVDTPLGDASLALRGSAGATSSARGSASAGIQGLEARGSARAQVGAEGEVDARFRSALVDANARLKGGVKAYGEASGTATANLKEGLRAKGKAEVGASAQVTYDADFRTAGAKIGKHRLDVNGRVHANAEVSARAGAEAEVAATVRPPRLLCDAKAEAFAGVKAGVKGSVGVGDFLTLSGHADVWAGAGAEACVQAGYDDGKLKFAFNLGAAIEVGAGAGFAIELDVKKIGESLLGGTLDAVGLDALARELGLLETRGGRRPRFDLFQQLPMLFPPSLFANPVDDEQARRALEALERALKRIGSNARPPRMPAPGERPSVKPPAATAARPRSEAPHAG